MVVEIVGTRVLTPFFGVGLHVWSALLVVTLGSLAAGYYVGGLLADRQSRFTLPAQLVAAGAWVSVCPLLRSRLLLSLDGADLRVGALAAATVLFGPALCMLGMANTTAVKLSITAASSSGQAAGRIYSLSTVGSLFGTLLAGFWLVPNYPVGQILWGTALILIVTGGSGLVAEGRRGIAGVAVVPLVLAPLWASSSLPGDVRVIARSQSLYGNLAVIEDTSRATSLKLLRADHSLIGGQWATGSPAFGFVHILEAGRFARPKAQRALLIGLGIGSTANALMKAGLTVDVIELDRGVVELAQEHFGFHTNGEIFVEDARTSIRRSTQMYDLIVHDTFTGGSTPEHLLSVEVMQQLSARLTEHGLLTLNMVGSASGALAPATLAVHRTLRDVFSTCRAFQDGPIKELSELHNIVFFAANQAIEFGPKRERGIADEQRRRILSDFTKWEILRDSKGGQLITDDYNPIAQLATPVAEKFHAQMRQLYPAEFWAE